MTAAREEHALKREFEARGGEPKAMDFVEDSEWQNEYSAHATAVEVFSGGLPY